MFFQGHPRAASCVVIPPEAREHLQPWKSGACKKSWCNHRVKLGMGGLQNDIIRHEYGNGCHPKWCYLKGWAQKLRTLLQQVILAPSSAEWHWWPDTKAPHCILLLVWDITRGWHPVVLLAAEKKGKESGAASVTVTTEQQNQRLHCRPRHLHRPFHRHWPLAQKQV